MHLNLLINLSIENSELVLYFYNLKTKKHVVINYVRFDNENLIINSAITNNEKLKKLLDDHLKILLKNYGITLSDIKKIDAILPFQVPALSNEILTKEQVKNHQKEFDKKQFSWIATNKQKIAENQYEVVSCFVNKFLYDQYQKILNELNIYPNNYSIPALILGHSFYKQNNNNYNCMIELAPKKTIYNFYHKDVLVKSKGINVGIDYIAEDLKRSLVDSNLNINVDNFDFKNIFNCFKNYGYSFIQDNIPVLVVNDVKQTMIIELFPKNIKDYCWHNIHKIFIDGLNKYKEKENINFINTVMFFQNEFFYNLFADNLKEHSSYRWTTNEILNPKELEEHSSLVTCFLKNKNAEILALAK